MKDQHKILKAINEPWKLLGNRDTCNVDECTGKPYSLGVCHKHYQAAYRYRTRHRKIREQ